MTETYVEGQFSAAHIGPYADGVHGHDWFVRAYFENTQLSAITLMEKLDEVLARYDHKCLDDIINHKNATNEGMATIIKWGLEKWGCTKVEVWRYHKNRRFGAVV